MGRASITVYIPSQGSVICVERNTSISPLFLLLLLFLLILLTLLQSKLLLVVPHLRLLSILVETSKWLLVLGRLHPISPHMGILATIFANLSCLTTIFANLGGHLSCITCPWEDLATRVPGGSWKGCRIKKLISCFESNLVDGRLGWPLGLVGRPCPHIWVVAPWYCFHLALDCNNCHS